MTKYDGSIFRLPEESKDPTEPARQAATSPPPLDREDVNAIVAQVRDDVEAADLSLVGEAAQKIAQELLLKCDMIEAANSGNSAGGLTLKLTPMALVELGYLWCQFRVQAGGFERDAGMGKQQDKNLLPNRRGTDMPNKVPSMFDDGESIRGIAAKYGVGKSVVETWKKNLRNRLS